MWLFFVLAIFPVLFVTIWCVVVYLLATLSGWARLAQVYRADERPEGTRFGRQSGKIGWVTYNNCLTIVVNRQGLHLTLFPLFRIGHPPLSIPWSEFHRLREKHVLRWRFFVAEIGEPVMATVQLPMHLLKAKPSSPIKCG